MTKFPHCARLGLQVFNEDRDFVPFVRAADVERLEGHWRECCLDNERLAKALAVACKIAGLTIDEAMERGEG